MAKRYETVTVEPAANTPVEVLHLSTPEVNSVDGRLVDWRFAGSNDSTAAMDMGIGVTPTGGMNAFENDMKFEGEGSFL